jgi:hypothetical protein
MFAQDPVTGQLYDVPDHYPYGIGYAQAPLILYDGLGNPVGGFWDTITSAAKALVPAVASAIPGIGPAIAAAAPLVSNLLSPSAPVRPPMPAAMPPPMAAMPPVPAGAFQTAPAPTTGLMPYPPPGSFPAPIPPGWVHPTLPYTGLQPRRFYMRCAAWPGPRGLVPSAAATMAPGIVPPTVVPPVVVPPVRAFRPRHRRR